MSIGVYIKGMEMPTRCYTCPCADLEYYDCNLIPGTRIELHKRLDDCPLAPVPEHGDLIDKHTLIDGILYELGASEAIGDKEEYAHWERVLTYVRKAQTIIPADKEGEG